MKIAITSLFVGLFLTSSALLAQVGNYTFSYSTGTYTPITDGIIFPAENHWIQTVNLPFIFVYNGIVYDRVQVNIHGWVAFGDNLNNAGFNNDIGASIINPVVAPLWDNLQVWPDSGAVIRYKTVGTAPNREFVVQWENARWNNDLALGTHQNFQVHLFENGGKIEFHYGAMSVPHNASASIGINGEVGGSGDFLSITPWVVPLVSSTTATNTIDGITHLTNGLIYTFEPPVGTGLDLAVGVGTQPLVHCYSTTETVEIPITNLGSLIDFSVDNAVVGVTIAGPNPQTLSTTLNSGTLGSGSTQVVTISTTYDMTAVGTYEFEPFVDVVNDVESTNDTSRVFTLVTDSVVPLPISVNFDGFLNNAPNWYAANGPVRPSFPGSGWSLSYGSTLTGTVALVRLFNNYSDEWLVGPKISVGVGDLVRYRVSVNDLGPIFCPAAMGSDDKLEVRVSTDCGNSWVTIDVVDASLSLGAALTTRTVSLAPYVGQEIIVAFFATDGIVSELEDYTLHLDDIFIGVPPPVDLGEVVLDSPLAIACYTNNETVQVTIENMGSQILDFSVDSATVTVEATGTNAQTLSAVLTSGVLAPGGTQQVVLSTTFDMSVVGTYTLQAYVNIAGDGIIKNDSSLVSNMTGLPLVTLPEQVDFSGYSGFNLNWDYPNWYEGVGETVPCLIGSDWTNANPFTAFGTSAKIQLNSNIIRSWILGPIFTATAGDEFKFKVAVTDASVPLSTDSMGSDDRLFIMVSTDCGGTWSAIDSIDASDNISNVLTQQSYSLASYAGQNIRVALQAHEGIIAGPEDYDLIIDDIFIGTPPPNKDLTVTAILDPVSGSCAIPNQEVKVVVENIGGLDQSNFPITVDITGAVTTTLNTTYSNTLIAGGIDTVSIGFYNASIGGSSTLTAYTALSNDANLTNDTLVYQLIQFTVPPLVLSPDTAVCDGLDFTFTANGQFNSYVWSNGVINSSITVGSAATYMVTATASNGCGNAVDSVTLSLLSVPSVDLGGDTAFCTGGSVNLNAPAGQINYLWSTGASSLGITVNSTGVYYCEVTDAQGCIGRDTVLVTVNPLPSIQLGNDTSVCEGEVVTLNSGNFVSYFWSTTETTGFIDVVNSGVYYCEVTDAQGCIGIDSVLVTVNPLPNIQLGNDTSVCEGEEMTLNPGNFASYIWSTTETSASINVVDPGVYSVTVVDNIGCENSDDVAVSLFLPPVILGSDTTVLNGDSLVLDPGAAFTSFLWSDNSTLSTYTVSGSEQVTVQVVDTNGCAWTDVMNIVIWAVGLDEKEDAVKISIYPNPSQGLVNLEVEGIKESSFALRLLSLHGQLLYEEQLFAVNGSVRQTLDFSFLAQGFYLLEVTIGKQKMVNQLLVK